MKKLFIVVLVLFPLILLAQDEADKENDKPDKEKILSQVESFKKAVSKIRDKKFRENFNVGLKTKNELEKFILKQTEKPEFTEEIEKAQAVLLKLGLIKPELDLKKTMIDMLTEQVAGFYDPEKGELFLMERSAGTPMQDMVLSHEIFHALQDQYYHIDAMMLAIRGNDDLGLAMKSIIEGEATIGGLEYMFMQSGGSILNLPIDVGSMIRQQSEMTQKSQPNSALAKAPRILRETLMFSYSYGASFIQSYLQKHKSWKKIDALFEKPPLSTEQLMHPEKYLKTIDYPVLVELPEMHKNLEGEWKDIISSNMGEFQIYLLLSEFIDKDTATRAAAGWDGDSYNLIESEGKDKTQIFSWLSVWDSDKDAKEFVDAYVQALEKRFNTKSASNGTQYLLQNEKSGETALLEYAGTQALVIQGASESLLPEVRKALLEARQVVMKEAGFEKLSNNKLELPKQPAEEKKESQEKKPADKEF